MLTQGQGHTSRSRDSAAGDLAVVQTAVLFPCDGIMQVTQPHQSKSNIYGEGAPHVSNLI